MGEISEKFVMATMVGLGVRVHATLPEAYGGPYFNEIDLRTMFGHGDGNLAARLPVADAGQHIRDGIRHTHVYYLGSDRRCDAIP